MPVGERRLPSLPVSIRARGREVRSGLVDGSESVSVVATIGFEARSACTALRVLRNEDGIESNRDDQGSYEVVDLVADEVIPVDGLIASCAHAVAWTRGLNEMALPCPPAKAGYRMSSHVCRVAMRRSK